MLLFEMLTGAPACVAPKGARAVSIYATRDEFPLFAESTEPLQDVIRQMTKRNSSSRLTASEVYERLLAIKRAASPVSGFPAVPVGNMSLIGLSRQFKVQLPSGATPTSANKAEAPRTLDMDVADAALSSDTPPVTTPDAAAPPTSRPEDITLVAGMNRQALRNDLLKLPEGEFDSFYLIWFSDTYKRVGSKLEKNERINQLLMRHEPAEIVDRLHRFRCGGYSKAG
jgi:hypothetical protein